MNDLSVNIQENPDRYPPPLSKTYELKLDEGTGSVNIPERETTEPMPVIIFLHGAAHADGGALAYLLQSVNSRRFILLAPSAHRDSWDILRGGWGPDITSVNRLLNWLRARYRVNDEGISVMGFSDGASYALSLGLRSPAIARIAALSPGFYLGNLRQDLPVFIGHGVNDAVLPYSGALRIKAEFESGGSEVSFVSHKMGHSCPDESIKAALTFCLCINAKGKHW
ncbi:alpha/beta hydrolase [Photorhabdus viridis]|uniref:alpha/beta hydrolase n=1 Tax=Photorhabdus viridis TaxID=3163327 RepID=UPI003307AE9A